MNFIGFDKAKVEDLIQLYKSFFSVHSIFENSEAEVKEYLLSQAEKHGFIAYEKNNTISSAVFFIRQNKTMKGDHMTWKLKHFAFRSEDAALKLLDEIEKKLKQESKTAKVEVWIADTEKGYDLFRSQGYREEGKLKNHYRLGEEVFILGKSI